MRHRRNLKACRPVSAGQDNNLKKSLVSGWKMWRDLQADLNALTFTVGAGSYGDASSGRELNNLDINAFLAKSGYPSDLKFDFASSIQLENSGVKTDYEDLTSAPAVDEGQIRDTVIAFDGTMRYDMRTDTFVTIKYDLPKSPAWARRVSLLIDYKYFSDNVPPFIRAVMSAASQHNSLAFKIQAEL